jgi:hypothetical protein
MAWNPDDPLEKRKRIAWSVATSSCIETGKDPVDSYNQIMKEWDDQIEKSQSVSGESR